MVYFATIILEGMIICLIIWAIATRNVIPKEWFEIEGKLIVEVENEQESNGKNSESDK